MRGRLKNNSASQGARKTASLLIKTAIESKHDKDIFELTPAIKEGTTRWRGPRGKTANWRRVFLQYHGIDWMAEETGGGVREAPGA